MWRGPLTGWPSGFKPPGCHKSPGPRGLIPGQPWSEGASWKRTMGPFSAAKPSQGARALQGALSGSFSPEASYRRLPEGPSPGRRRTVSEALGRFLTETSHAMAPLQGMQYRDSFICLLYLCSWLWNLKQDCMRTHLLAGQQNHRLGTAALLANEHWF